MEMRFELNEKSPATYGASFLKRVQLLRQRGLEGEIASELLLIQATADQTVGSATAAGIVEPEWIRASSDEFALLVKLHNRLLFNSCYKEWGWCFHGDWRLSPFVFTVELPTGRASFRCSEKRFGPHYYISRVPSLSETRIVIDKYCDSILGLSA